MTYYYIFKTNKVTGEITHICNGSHEGEDLCRIHWQGYMYGFMDAAFEMLGRENFQMMESREHKLGFEFHIPANNHTVEFFMLFDDAGQQLIQDISRKVALGKEEVQLR